MKFMRIERAESTKSRKNGNYACKAVFLCMRVAKGNKNARTNETNEISLGHIIY